MSDQGLGVRRLHLAAWVAVAGGACGGEAQGPGAGQTRISYLRQDNPPFIKADDEAFALYTKDHPDVEIVPTTVKYQSLSASLMAELKQDALDADLVAVIPSWVCTFADNLADVPADVATLAQAQAAFFAPPLAGSTCNGRLKGLPVEYNLEYGGVVVNVGKYQERFPGKDPGWTDWAGFIAEARALSEYEGEVARTNGLDIDPIWPQPAKHIFLSQILQRGGSYWAAGGEAFDFKSAAARESLEEMVNWIVRERVMSRDLVPERNTFVTTRLAMGATGYGWNDLGKPLSVMGYAGTWAVPNTIGQVPPGMSRRYEFYTVPPMVGTQHKFVQNSGWSFVVPKTSKNAARAWDVARSIALDPQGARRWAAIAGTLPALRENGTREAAAADPLLSKVLPLLEHGQWVGYIPAAAIETVEGAIVSAFFDAAAGKKTIDEALTQMQDTANTALRQHR
jgi:multiple sugar transport system substrate-binding protein